MDKPNIQTVDILHAYDEGIYPVSDQTYSKYILDMASRQEGVGMASSRVIFKEMYEEELNPDFETGKPTGFTYAFNHMLIQTNSDATIIDTDDTNWIDITNVVSYPSWCQVFIKPRDINNAFARHLIDHATENLILCNRLLAEMHINKDTADKTKEDLESYKVALRCIKLYNKIVAPTLCQKPLILFTTTGKNGNQIVNFV